MTVCKNKGAISMVFLPLSLPRKDLYWETPVQEVTCDACGKIYTVQSDIQPGEYRAICLNCKHIITVKIKDLKNG